MRQERIGRWLGCLSLAAAVLASGAFVAPARADETCQSPFLPKVTGQEDYIYVWTLGVKGSRMATTAWSPWT